MSEIVERFYFHRRCLGLVADGHGATEVVDRRVGLSAPVMDDSEVRKGFRLTAAGRRNAPLLFSLTLGQRPPVGQRAEWLAAAESLVPCRVMYDHVSPFGPDIVTDAVQRRLRIRASERLKQFATT